MPQNAPVIFDEVRLELALSAARLGSYDWDPETGELSWDARLVEMFGYDIEEFVPHIDSFSARVHPDDREMVELRLQQAVEHREDFLMDYRIVMPDGAVKWISARGRAVPYGEDGRVRLLGLVFDSTEVHATQERVYRILETMGDAFLSLDNEWRFTYVNAEAERLLGRTREQLLGKNVWVEYPEGERRSFKENYQKALDTGDPVSFEEYYPEPLDTWFEVRAFPSAEGLAVYFHDIADRKEEERERLKAQEAEEAANQRLQVLAESTGRLAEILEPERILDALVQIVVPDLATWAVVTLREEEVRRLSGDEGGSSSSLRVVRVAHSAPEDLPALQALAEAAVLSVQDEEGAGAVVRTGEARYIADVSREAAARGDTEESHPALAVVKTAVLTVPLTARSRVLGALSVTSENPYPLLDQTLVEDLARRAAVALENAVLYKAEQRTALDLQRSLLPRLPTRLPSVDLATRYLPGARGAEIGGDWYEALRRRDGKIGLVIGDVMGHSVKAAGQMGQLRLAVATLALQGQGPAQILQTLSRDISDLLDLELATVLCAVYDPEGRTLTVASAGHPPVLLNPPGGEAAHLEVEPGPPLGVGQYEYTESVAEIPIGSHMVFYTDGLVESRDRGVDEDLEILRVALGEIPSTARPERVCDTLLETVRERSGASDDVALMVVRHP